MSHLLALGLGYAASRLAKRLSAKGWTIAGTSRSPEGAKQIAGRGWSGIHFNGDRPIADLRRELARATHVLASIPPGADGDPALLCHAADIEGSPNVRWIGYFSTVGVYGDRGGGWVDETTPVAPLSERARRRVAAENEWRRLGQRSGNRVVVFRLPGIYGPGRSPFDALRAGTARRIVKAGQVFNRIHVDDIASVVEAAMDRPTINETYNVTDDAPSAPDEVIAFAAQLLGMEPPPAIPIAEAALSPMAASFYAESKRASNARLKADLGIDLDYPTFREGLGAILAEETAIGPAI